MIYDYNTKSCILEKQYALQVVENTATFNTSFSLPHRFMFDFFQISLWTRKLHKKTTYLYHVLEQADTTSYLKLKDQNGANSVAIEWKNVQKVSVTTIETNNWRQYIVYKDLAMNVKLRVLFNNVDISATGVVTEMFLSNIIPFWIGKCITGCVNDGIAPLYALKNLMIGSYPLYTNDFDNIYNYRNSNTFRDLGLIAYFKFDNIYAAINGANYTMSVLDEISNEKIVFATNTPTNIYIELIPMDDSRTSTALLRHPCSNLEKSSVLINIETTVNCESISGLKITSSTVGTNLVPVNIPTNFHLNIYEFTFQAYFKLNYITDLANLTRKIDLFTISNFIISELSAKIKLDFGSVPLTLTFTTTQYGYKWIAIAFSIFKDTKITSKMSFYLNDEKTSSTLGKTNFTNFSPIVLNKNASAIYIITYSYIKLWNYSMSFAQYKYSINSNYNNDFTKLISYFDMKLFYTNTNPKKLFDITNIAGSAYYTATESNIAYDYEDFCTITDQFNNTFNNCNPKRSLTLKSTTSTIPLTLPPGLTTSTYLNFSIELWFAYTTDASYTSTSTTDILKTTNASNGFSLELAANYLLSFVLNYSTTITITNTEVINKGIWNYVAITYTKNIKKITSIVNDTEVVNSYTNAQLAVYIYLFI